MLEKNKFFVPDFFPDLLISFCFSTVAVGVGIGGVWRGLSQSLRLTRHERPLRGEAAPRPPGKLAKRSRTRLSSWSRSSDAKPRFGNDISCSIDISSETVDGWGSVACCWYGWGSPEKAAAIWATVGAWYWLQTQFYQGQVNKNDPKMSDRLRMKGINCWAQWFASSFYEKLNSWQIEILRIFFKKN